MAVREPFTVAGDVEDQSIPLRHRSGNAISSLLLCDRTPKILFMEEVLQVLGALQTFRAHYREGTFMPEAQVRPDPLDGGGLFLDGLIELLPVRVIV
ncbi:hypothetical protein [Nocardiopsis alba]|uniref:hypothetical protein n=1 Tax=Nocardiopsis alba TaxID=53437 RepID=UPI0036830479